MPRNGKLICFNIWKIFWPCIKISEQIIYFLRQTKVLIKIYLLSVQNLSQLPKRLRYFLSYNYNTLTIYHGGYPPKMLGILCQLKLFIYTNTKHLIILALLSRAAWSYVSWLIHILVWSQSTIRQKSKFIGISFCIEHCKNSLCFHKSAKFSQNN